jgi:hypothetical protein
MAEGDDPGREISSRYREKPGSCPLDIDSEKRIGALQSVSQVRRKNTDPGLLASSEDR